MEALYDDSSNLTYLHCLNWQTETVHSGCGDSLLCQCSRFQKRKEYTYEVKFVKILRNWRRAVEGLNQLQRCATIC